MEYPHTSKSAQILAFFSLSMVILSTVTFIISTAEELQDGSEDATISAIVFVIDAIDNFVALFFTIEYIIRFVICPRKIKFFIDPMNGRLGGF